MPQGEDGPVRLLYIDDDAALGRLVQRQLGRRGWQVALAPDGAAGQLLLAQGGFDVVALDHYMPGRDGLEILAGFAGRPAMPPVVFVTAAQDAQTAVAALKAGAADYVVKDAQGAFVDLLAAAVQQALAQVRMRQAKEAAEREVRQTLDRLEQVTARQALLVREVNHRVANSLQLISSLITLQAGRVGGEAAEVLRHAATRVEAVMLVHRRLYTSDDVRSVEMAQYLDGLLGELRQAADDRNLSLSLHAEALHLPTDTAICLGLIVNELVSNAVKYAYPAGQAGAVRVRFGREGAGEFVQLTVEDDGVGQAPEQTPRGTGFGSVIVASMARTMRAEVSRDADHAGTRVTVRLRRE
jgi:two-component sensor histidine kinase/CheY-like chemotaxis protein